MNSVPPKSQRLNRRTYIAAFFISAIPWVAIAGIANVANGLHGTAQSIIFGFFAILILIAVLYWLVTFFVATLNRVHDIGWHWIIVPIFGFFTPFLLILALMPGKKLRNKYGPITSNKFDLRTGLIWW
jgi:uncharacterized membrane protein YhaH (DUF805 family)